LAFTKKPSILEGQLINPIKQGIWPGLLFLLRVFIPILFGFLGKKRFPTWFGGKIFLEGLNSQS